MGVDDNKFAREYCMNQQVPLAEVSQQSVSRYVDDEIDLMELFAVLWAGKWLVLGVTVLAVLVAGLWVLQQPKMYSVSTIFTVAGKMEVRSLYDGTELSELSELSASHIKSVDFQKRILGEGLLVSVKGPARKNKEYSVAVKTVSPDGVADQLNQLVAAASISAMERVKALKSDGLELQIKALLQLLKSDFVRLAEPAARAELQKELVLLKARLLQLEMVEGLRVINVIKPAADPVVPVSPKPKIVLALAVVLGVMFGVFTLFVRHAISGYKSRQLVADKEVA
jgi:LPS O-antigen subunit length determinant protein (WzzB/FepE family)